MEIVFKMQASPMKNKKMKNEKEKGTSSSK